MIVSISQPNYVPWIGYFDMVAASDVFVLYDDVQYTRNDWRNRNRIKTPGSNKWLSVPVTKMPRDALIRDIDAVDLNFCQQHLEKLSQAYRQAACFDAVFPKIESWYSKISSRNLVDINEHLMRQVCAELGISTRIIRSSNLEKSGDRSERLLNVCRFLGADTYISGRAAENYLDVDLFRQSGTDVAWVNYAYAGEYPQPHPPFDRAVSILDVLLCCGDAASEQMIHQKSNFLVPAGATE